MKKSSGPMFICAVLNVSDLLVTLLFRFWEVYFFYKIMKGNKAQNLSWY